MKAGGESDGKEGVKMISPTIRRGGERSANPTTWKRGRTGEKENHEECREKKKKIARRL